VRTLVNGVRIVLVVSVAVAALAALAGFLVAHVTGAATAAHGAGWGMAIGGCLLGLVVGQSGSPSRTAVGGRWGSFGQLWGGNAALPDSPLWLLLVAVLVIALGIAVVVLG